MGTGLFGSSRVLAWPPQWRQVSQEECIYSWDQQWANAQHNVQREPAQTGQLGVGQILKWHNDSA